MAGAETESEGEEDNLIQVYEISSTSEIYSFPLRPSHSLFPQCRSSYRRRFLPNINYHPNPVMLNPSVVNLSKIVIINFIAILFYWVLFNRFCSFVFRSKSKSKIGASGYCNNQMCHNHSFIYFCVFVDLTSYCIW